MERKELQNAKRIVVKVGSQLLSSKEGLNESFIENLARQFKTLVQMGKEVVLVSSGAVLAGIKALNMSRRPYDITEKQALSAVGQPYLMSAYRAAFSKFGLNVAQVLLTADDLREKERFLNASNTFNALMRLKVVPIVNENDTVCVDEIKIGDNDNLSAHVSVVFGAELLIILTVPNGLYDKNPEKFKDAKLIKRVSNIEDVLKTCNLSGESSFGTGGMLTKLLAAQKAVKKGIAVVIASGLEDNVLLDVLKGKEVGTFFEPQKTLKAKTYRILYLHKAKARILVDAGAENALKFCGKSLLSKGIVKIEGDFSKGDVVEIANQDGEVFAKGTARCSKRDISNCKLVIHRNDMVILR